MSSLPRIGGRSKWRLNSYAKQRPTAGQQGIACKGGARVHAEGSEIVTADWAEAAHLKPRHIAPICKILSAERGLAAPENDGALARSRAVDLMTGAT